MDFSVILEKDGSLSPRSLFSTYKEENDVTVLETDLKDVLFCLFLALGWTVWMLTSFVRSDVAKYDQDSILVQGNVLNVTPLQSYDPEPQYRCLIDYTVDAPSTDHPHKKSKAITIRKYFVTGEELENGFANVEVLVLPQDPHQSILRVDWEKECRDTQMDHFCWETKAFKRMSIGFGLVLVLASVAGAVLAVEHMPDELKAYGWAALTTGTVVLLPLAVLIHRIVTLIQNSLDAPHQGTVVVGTMEEELDSTSMGCLDCDRLDVLDARACDDDPLDSKQQATSTFRQKAAGFGCYFVEMPDGGGASKRSSSSVSTVSSISLDRQASNNHAYYSNQQTTAL